jgi:hypothetical protein
MASDQVRFKAIYLEIRGISRHKAGLTKSLKPSRQMHIVALALASVLRVPGDIRPGGSTPSEPAATHKNLPLPWSYDDTWKHIDVDLESNTK